MRVGVEDGAAAAAAWVAVVEAVVAAAVDKCQLRGKKLSRHVYTCNSVKRR